LQRLMPAAMGALAQDGGVAVDNLMAQLPEQDWEKTVRQFFLT
jgi:hypothetical protein